MKKCTALLLLVCLLASLLPTALADAADVTAMIAAIPDAAIENEAAIDAAYMAYYQLSEEERANVTNWDTLLALREELPKAYVVGERQGTRVPWHKFRIGTYGYADVLWNEEDIKTLAEGGIDFVASAYYQPAEMFDTFEKYGIGLSVGAWAIGLPHYIWRPESTSEPYVLPYTIEEWTQHLEENFVDHPAIWSIELPDEPHAAWFDILGQEAEVLAEKYPELNTYLNLFPMVHPKRTGTVSYEEYVRMMHEQVGLDFTCYDHYMYSGDNRLGDLVQFVSNLDVVRHVDQELGTETWVVIQANTAEENHPKMDAKRLKLQAYVAMAFGAKSITWSCWSSIDRAHSWWYNCIVNDAGEPTAVYYDVQALNADLHALGPVFMRYTQDASCAIGYAATAHERMLERDPGAYMGHLVNVPEELHDLTFLDENFTDEYLAEHGFGMTASHYQAWPGHESTTQNWAFDAQYTTTHDVSMGQDTFLNLATDGRQDAVLVGHFTKNVGEGEAIMLVNVSNPNFARLTGTSILKPYTEINPTVTFTVNKENPVVTLYVKGIPSILEPVDGVYSVTLNMEDAAFITVD